MNWTVFLHSVAAATGATTALVAMGGFLAKAWFMERLGGSIKHKYDGQLENLKASLKDQSDKSTAQLRSEIDRQTDTLRAAVSSFPEVQRATIGGKIEAVNILWGVP